MMLKNNTDTHNRVRTVAVVSCSEQLEFTTQNLLDFRQGFNTGGTQTLRSSVTAIHDFHPLNIQAPTAPRCLF